MPQDLHFRESFQCNLFVNLASLFRFVHRISARTTSEGNIIPSVISHSTNSIHQDLNPDDDESDYDADNEMDDDEGYIEDDGANNDEVIQFEVNEILEHENEDMLFVFPYQEETQYIADILNVVCNQINIAHINSGEVFDNIYIYVENEGGHVDE